MITRRSIVGAGLGAAAGAFRLIAAPAVPRPAPELMIILNSGEQVYLSKLKGRVVVLEFLLTNCPHCQRCSTTVQKLFSELGEQAFQPLGTAINPENQAQARLLLPEYIYKLGLKFPVGYTPRDMAYNWLQANVAAGPVYFPQLVFIDKKGTIRAQYAGTDDFFKDEETNIRKMIASLNGEGSGSQGAAAKGAGKK